MGWFAGGIMKRRARCHTSVRVFRSLWVGVRIFDPDGLSAFGVTRVIHRLVLGMEEKSHPLNRPYSTKPTFLKLAFVRNTTVPIPHSQLEGEKSATSHSGETGTRVTNGGIKVSGEIMFNYIVGISDDGWLQCRGTYLLCGENDIV